MGGYTRCLKRWSIQIGELETLPSLYTTMDLHFLYVRKLYQTILVGMMSIMSSLERPSKPKVDDGLLFLVVLRGWHVVPQSSHTPFCKLSERPHGGPLKHKAKELSLSLWE
jgi:hypothetical protein